MLFSYKKIALLLNYKLIVDSCVYPPLHAMEMHGSPQSLATK